MKMKVQYCNLHRNSKVRREILQLNDFLISFHHLDYGYRMKGEKGERGAKGVAGDSIRGPPG